MESKFWVVWQPMGRNPSFRHTSEAGATIESKRLAGLYPNLQFFVLEAKHFSVHQTVKTVQLA